MTHNIYLYIFVMAAVTYLIRVLPVTLIRRPIRNRFLQSFLYYVPYVTLSVMTFPAITRAAQSPVSGVLALLVGIVVAFLGGGLFRVALSCCGTVLVVELVMTVITL